jgi:hypothetical protein
MRPVFRRLARFSRFQLGAAYTACITVAALLYGIGGESHPVIHLVGWFVAIGSFSALFTVVTWYRSDQVPGAAFLLAVSTAFGFVVGLEIALLFFIPSAGAAALLGVGALMGLPIRILVLALVFALLVAVGRQFRGVFAPDTLESEGEEGDGRAA